MHDAWLKQESIASFKTPECQNKLTCMNSHMKDPNSLKWHNFCSSQVVLRSHNNKDVQAQSKTGSPKINMFERAIDVNLNALSTSYMGAIRIICLDVKNRRQLT